MDKQQRMHWMPWNIPAYWADTRGFSAEKHGAYMMLLGELWMRKGVMRADDPDLPTLACCAPDRWAEIGPTIMAKFDVSADGFLSQKRLLAEFAHAQKVSERRREAGKKGGRPQKQLESNCETNSFPNGKQTETQTQTQTHSTNVENISTPAAQEVGGGYPQPTKAPGEKKKPAASKAGPSPEFLAAWAIYPKRAGDNSRADA